jgi:hypothetical protein
MEARPIAGAAPDLSAGTEILRDLLAIERERLLVAREIEKQRSIVFPETSVIVRDIERLLSEIERREAIPDVPAKRPSDNRGLADAIATIGARRG